MLGDIPKGNISLRRLKIHTANFFQFVPFIQIKKKRILFLQTQKRKYKGSYSKIFFDNIEFGFQQVSERTL